MNFSNLCQHQNYGKSVSCRDSSIQQIQQNLIWNISNREVQQLWWLQLQQLQHPVVCLRIHHAWHTLAQGPVQVTLLSMGKLFRSHLLFGPFTWRNAIAGHVLFQEMIAMVSKGFSKISVTCKHTTLSIGEVQILKLRRAPNYMMGW